MAGINVKRWVMGGVVAGIIVFILEGMASVLYTGPMTEALERHGLSMEMSAGMFVLALLVSLLGGLVAVFFYAAARPRFGPGPKTALIVAVAPFAGGYLLSLIGYHMLGLFPGGLLLTWGCIGLIEMVVATMVGGAIYREA